MALSLSKTSQTETEWKVESVTSTLPRWPGYLMAVAATSILIGILWDISWHMSIGRDTFWTPAHMAIYFGGALAGCIGGWLALKCTFFPSPEERDASVNILGARAPLGAWVTIWGALAMLTSAPFDDWWHNAYGLDVKIISPPHSVLGLGMLAVSLGALLLTLARQNREANGAGSGLFIYMAGVFLTFGSVFITEFTYPNMQHGYQCYKWCAFMLPIRLVTMGRAGRISWATTRVAAVYMTLQCLMVWILPLFPAQPKLAPIFTPLTHMVPPLFPLLLVVPAFGIDLFLRNMGDDDDRWQRPLSQWFVSLADAIGEFYKERVGERYGSEIKKMLVRRNFEWLARQIARVGRAMIVGAIFLSLLLLTQWFFSEFMLSSHAENWFFAGNRNWSYGTWPGEWHKEYWDMNRSAPDNQVLTPVRLMKCWLIASAMSWVALVWGGWLRKVKR